MKNWFHRCCWWGIRIPFSSFLFALFVKTSCNRVNGIMTKNIFFPKLRFTLYNRISCLCKQDFRLGSWVTVDEIWDSSSDSTLSVSNGRSRIRNFPTVIYSASRSWTSVWNGMEGSMTKNFYFFCRLWKKFFSFFWECFS